MVQDCVKESRNATRREMYKVKSQLALAKQDSMVQQALPPYALSQECHGSGNYETLVKEDGQLCGKPGNVVEIEFV